MATTIKQHKPTPKKKRKKKSKKEYKEIPMAIRWAIDNSLANWWSPLEEDLEWIESTCFLLIKLWNPNKPFSPPPFLLRLWGFERNPMRIKQLGHSRFQLYKLPPRKSTKTQKIKSLCIIYLILFTDIGDGQWRNKLGELPAESKACKIRKILQDWIFLWPWRKQADWENNYI